MYSIPHMNSNNLPGMNGENKVPKSSDYLNQERNYVSKHSHGINQADSEVNSYITLQHTDFGNNNYESLT